AKSQGVAVVLVGHVTKDGQVAGPRVVEHMVDAVLSFEGERGYPFRILRAGKNRFGATDEIGVFEVGDAGLREVANPSALFLGDSKERAPGSAVFAGIEGSRPVLVEVQALAAPSAYGTPRRAVGGWASGHGAGGAGGPRRPRLRRPRRLSERGRGAAHQRAGGRSGGGGGADQLGHRHAAAAGLRGVRRDQSVRRGARRGAGRSASARGGQAGLRSGPVAAADG